MTAPDHMPPAFKKHLHDTGHPHMEPPINPGRFTNYFDFTFEFGRFAIG